jgi:hypothetical protein
MPWFKGIIGELAIGGVCTIVFCGFLSSDITEIVFDLTGCCTGFGICCWNCAGGLWTGAVGGAGGLCIVGCCMGCCTGAGGLFGAGMLLNIPGAAGVRDIGIFACFGILFKPNAFNLCCSNTSRDDFVLDVESVCKYELSLDLSSKVRVFVGPWVIAYTVVKYAGASTVLTHILWVGENIALMKINIHL